MKYTYKPNDNWKIYIRHCIHYVIWLGKYESVFRMTLKPLNSNITFRCVDARMSRQIIDDCKSHFAESRSRVGDTEAFITKIFESKGFYNLANAVTPNAEDEDVRIYDLNDDYCGNDLDVAKNHADFRREAARFRTESGKGAAFRRRSPIIDEEEYGEERRTAWVNDMVRRITRHHNIT